VGNSLSEASATEERLVNLNGKESGRQLEGKKIFSLQKRRKGSLMKTKDIPEYHRALSGRREFSWRERMPLFIRSGQKGTGRKPP